MRRQSAKIVRCYLQGKSLIYLVISPPISRVVLNLDVSSKKIQACNKGDISKRISGWHIYQLL